MKFYTNYFDKVEELVIEFYPITRRLEPISVPCRMVESGNRYNLLLENVYTDTTCCENPTVKQLVQLPRDLHGIKPTRKQISRILKITRKHTVKSWYTVSWYTAELNVKRFKSKHAAVEYARNRVLGKGFTCSVTQYSHVKFNRYILKSTDVKVNHE